MLEYSDLIATRLGHRTWITVARDFLEIASQTSAHEGAAVIPGLSAVSSSKSVDTAIVMKWRHAVVAYDISVSFVVMLPLFGR